MEEQVMLIDDVQGTKELRKNSIKTELLYFSFYILVNVD